jgi:hypothetical protein
MFSTDVDLFRMFLPIVLVGLPALWGFVSDPNESIKELKDLLKQGRFAQEAYVRSCRNALMWKLVGPMYLLCHVLNLLIVAALACAIFIGPQALAKYGYTGPLAKPLTSLEKVIFGVVLVINAVGYLLRGGIPFVKGWFVAAKATSFLRTYHE